MSNLIYESTPLPPTPPDSGVFSLDRFGDINVSGTKSSNRQLTNENFSGAVPHPPAEGKSGKGEKTRCISCMY